VSADLYSFVFRAQLAQEAANRALDLRTEDPKDSSERISQKMPLDLFDKDLIRSASKMASVYMAIAAFENSVRKFIQDRLLEEVGPDWWTTHVSQEIRNGAEQRKKDEEQTRWHGARGTSMIFYTQLGDLVSIMQQNVTLFESHIESIEWARQIVKALERSRNVIMHSGELSLADVERVSMNIRDWLRQVGG